MPRVLQLILFILVGTTLFGGIHYYFWARLVRDTAMPAPWSTVVTWVLVLLAINLPASMIAGRFAAPSVGRAVAWPAFLWMGFMMLLFLLLLGTDVVRLVVAVTRVVPDPERRLFLQRVLATVAAVGASGLGLSSIRAALAAVTQRDVEVPLARLPSALDGLVIVQLTDLHIGPTIGRAWLEEVVRRTNALQPDVIAITGDLVDGSVASLRDAVAPLGDLRARHGVYFVTGNHEYYAGADAWIAELGRLNVRTLRNERVSIGDGVASLDLAGVDDHSSRGQAPGHGPDLGRALAGRDASRELVLLAHQPKAIHEAARHGVGLQLSGHTHGGQIWPWRYMVRLQQPYVVGLIRHDDTQLYVSCGTGYWGPPMRLGAPSEITRLVLRAPAVSA